MKDNPDTENKLILIGGGPGSGKTFIAKTLATGYAGYIDKDTISELFIDKLLETAELDKGDRENEVYTNEIKPLEYETMMNHALENITLQNNIICSAPFITQFHSEKWINETETRTEEIGAKLILLWIHADATTARHRLITRGAPRDNTKLSTWTTYIKSMPYEKPDTSKILMIIDNSHQPTVPLNDQLKIVMEKIEQQTR